MIQLVRVSYFGYTAEFNTAHNWDSDIRAEANRIILAEYGAAPKFSYVEPGLPFPDYVPVQRYDPEDQDFY